MPAAAAAAAAAMLTGCEGLSRAATEGGGILRFRLRPSPSSPAGSSSSLGARPDAEGLGEDADDYPDEAAQPAAAGGGGSAPPPAKRGRGPARGGSGGGD